METSSAKFKKRVIGKEQDEQKEKRVKRREEEVEVK